VKPQHERLAQFREQASREALFVGPTVGVAGEHAVEVGVDEPLAGRERAFVGDHESDGSPEPVGRPLGEEPLDSAGATRLVAVDRPDGGYLRLPRRSEFLYAHSVSDCPASGLISASVFTSPTPRVRMSATVTPRCCGRMTMDKSILVSGERGVEIDAPSIVYLVEAEETLLVDTGFGDVESMAELHPDFDCRRPGDRTLEAVLAGEGYRPADVDAVVLTHLDWDHCYNLGLFGDAEVYVQRRELEYAVAPYPMHAERYEAKSLGREPPWLTVDLTPLDGETELCPGVTAFPTPGHTVGHQSLAVETGRGTTVVAADAVPTFENLDGDPFRRGLAMNDFEWWDSARAVRERADRILPGHEWGIVDAGPERTG